MFQNEEETLEDKIAKNKEVFDNYENDFCKELLNFIKKDKALKLFHERFLLECDNISDVIEKAGSERERNVGLLNGLKKINEGFHMSKGNADALADTDSKFHSILYYIANNHRLIEMSGEAVRAGGDLSKIWQSIIRNEDHYLELCKIHSAIVESIENKDKKAAVTAMQKHFTIVIIHYIQLLKSKPVGDKRRLK